MVKVFPSQEQNLVINGDNLELSPAVIKLSHPVKEISGGLEISYNPTIEEINLPNLTLVGGSLNIMSCGKIKTLALGELLEITGVGYINGNPLLETLDLAKLTTVGSLNLENNPVLTSINLGELTTVSSTQGLDLGNNNGLTSINLGKLATCGRLSYYAASPEYGVETFDLGELTTLGAFAINDDYGFLTSIDLSKITSITDSFSVNAYSVTSLDLGNSLTQCVLNFTALGTLTSFSLGVIGTFKKARDIDLRGNALDETSIDAILALVASLDGTNGTTSWGTGRKIYLEDGTNAAPSAAGLASKATIVARGGTVTHNS